LRLDLFIEDSHKEAESIAAIGISVLLINSPWNRDLSTSPNITRVNDWNEILRYVKAYTSF